MSTVRRSAVVLVALATAALTACGPGEDGAAGGPAAPSAPPSKSVTPTDAPTEAPTEPPTAAPTEAPTAAPTKAPAPSKPASPSVDPDYDVFPCSTFDVTFTATLAEPTTSSYLLKITNKGSKPCRALGHPVVTFGALDGQAVERGPAPGIEDAIRLAPGQSAYAGLMGGLKDGKGTTVHSIAMTMSTDSDLVQKPLKASTPGLYVSPDKNSVTAWMTNAEDALSL
ncbi:DUF4232 domain-containing protein [Streptomyces sp. TX20-6-3]|uniref:DUF4232 domain-containing protein n=1 Tax=Streptomyces sp. TX20-6-3 TaxID=3028705 RepID=UPI0029AA5C05|nr:DUF4232 domain-containing protein [Streptomyces sp. TX20-6-3]MDX2560668.1 DUF4232 domain-containing protein [Streptomyces sp. TX20-6-3]